MTVHTNYSLKKHNTFGLDVVASYFAPFSSVAELQEILLTFSDMPKFVLSGGSNILFLSNTLAMLVLHPQLRGIKVLKQTSEWVEVEVAAGENWHKFVMHAIANNWGGVENLALIPGFVGTTPVQNIGAYGVEIKDVLQSVKAVEISTGHLREFSLAECELGYRTSIFKTKLKNKFLITSVVLKLTTQHHQLKTNYAALATELEKRQLQLPTIADVAEAVIDIRQSKLPDPAELGNCGSFFQNPIISAEQYQQLLQKYPDIPTYPTANNNYKVAGGWLIEKTGLKGKRVGDVGMHGKQALVLVNYGNATGKQLWQHAQLVINSVQDKFNIKLVPEVNII